MFTHPPFLLSAVSDAVDVVVGNNPSDPYWASVILLCPFDGITTDVKTGIVPSSVNLIDLDANGKFAGGLKLTAANSYVKFAPRAGFAFTTQPFTIDGWVSIPSVPSNFYVFDFTNNGLCLHYTSGHWNVYGNGGQVNYNSAAYTLPLDTPLFFELSRSGTTLKLFINGVAVITQTISAATQFGVNAVVTIGNYGSSGYSMNGAIIDDFRITKGVQRNAVDYTPPTAPAAPK